MNCPNCGATMRLDDERQCLLCDYCETVYFPDENEQGVRVLGLPSQLKCPVCSVPLVYATVDQHRVEYCNQCRGVLIAMQAFTYVIEDMRSRRHGAGEIAPAPNPHGLERKINCPKCGRQMDTHYYGGGGNVVMDDCSPCGLNWFDAGELMAIARAPDHSWQYEERGEGREGGRS